MSMGLYPKSFVNSVASSTKEQETQMSEQEVASKRTKVFEIFLNIKDYYNKEYLKE